MMIFPDSLVIGQQLPCKAIAAPGFRVANGTIEALKWLALVLMTLDHVNTHLFAGKLPGVFELGRLAMPLFGFVLAFNLARPGALQSGVYLRTSKRLALFGLLSVPILTAFGGLMYGMWPLNIMFTLLVATATLYLIEKGGHYRWLAAVVFLVGGFLVESLWFGPTFCICAWLYCKTPSKSALVSLFFATALLYVANRNLWALAAIPLILLAPSVDVKLPRFRHLFYVYYPAHLAVLLIVTTLFGKHL